MSVERRRPGEGSGYRRTSDACSSRCTSRRGRLRLCRSSQPRSRPRRHLHTGKPSHAPRDVCVVVASDGLHSPTRDPSVEIRSTDRAVPRPSKRGNIVGADCLAQDADRGSSEPRRFRERNERLIVTFRSILRHLSRQARERVRGICERTQCGGLHCMTRPAEGLTHRAATSELARGSPYSALRWLLPRVEHDLDDERIFEQGRDRRPRVLERAGASSLTFGARGRMGINRYVVAKMGDVRVPSCNSTRHYLAFAHARDGLRKSSFDDRWRGAGLGVLTHPAGPCGEIFARGVPRPDPPSSARNCLKLRSQTRLHRSKPIRNRRCCIASDHCGFAPQLRRRRWDGRFGRAPDGTLGSLENNDC